MNRAPAKPLRATVLLLGLCITLAAGLAVARSPAPQTQAPAARALLIGVQDYPGLRPDLRLQAPAGDAARLRDGLVAAGLAPSAITLMTEREGARPTRGAVLQALARLAVEAHPGDQVLVYFSGHGAQAPARRPEREPDGLEELFLAADAGRWDGRTGALTGAIADFELEAALAAIQARGADVWFIADACHGGGLSRGGRRDGAVAKSVPAAALGIPVRGGALRGGALRGGARETAAVRAGPPARGRFTGFYAAAPGELAVERPWRGGGRVSAFSWGLTRALAEGRFRSLRDLALALAAEGSEIGANAPSPVFEGALDGPVLGLQPKARLWPVVRRRGALVVAAGPMEGFEPASRIELLGEDGALLGGGRVATSDLAHAELAPDRPAPEVTLFARPVPGGSGHPMSLSPGQRLLDVLAPLAGRGAVSELQVEARLWRQGCGPNPPARLGLPEAAGPIDPLQSPALRHCDVVYLAISNRSDDPVDLSPLYVDAAGSVAALSLSPDDDVRLTPGQTRYVAIRVLTRTASGRPLPHGLERLVLVAAPALGPARTDLRGLAGPDATRGAPATNETFGALIFPWRVGD